jgi:uncharacterized protein YukE
LATHSFPALGFDPAPGDPDAIEAVARDCKRCAADLSADADQLKRLTAHLDWQGAGADAFARHPDEPHDDLSRASDAYGGAGLALDGYASALRQAKLDAGRLEAEAAEAKARTERHGRDTEQASQAIEAASPATDASDQVLQRDASLRAISNTLKVVSAVAGVLSFIPVLSPFFAPIAGVTAIGALASMRLSWPPGPATGRGWPSTPP